MKCVIFVLFVLCIQNIHEFYLPSLFVDISNWPAFESTIKRSFKSPFWTAVTATYATADAATTLRTIIAAYGKAVKNSVHPTYNATVCSTDITELPAYVTTLWSTHKVAHVSTDKATNIPTNIPTNGVSFELPSHTTDLPAHIATQPKTQRTALIAAL